MALRVLAMGDEVRLEENFFQWTVPPAALQVTAREAPQGSLPAFASGDVVREADAADICPITEQHSLSP